MGLTAAKRVEAVIDYGFTERQARFLVLVMRHAGLCVKRQYAAFAGIANGGEKCSAFFEKLVRGGYAVASDCVHNRARLYHVHHKPLYHAIGDPESRYRRPVPARRAAERLMRLDAALTNPDLDWLTTRSEKVAHLKLRTAPESAAHLAEAMVQDVADLANLKRYFFHRRRGTDPTTVPESLRAFLERCAQVFAGPRFALLYRRWLTDGDAALSGVSPMIADALASDRAHVECVVLPHAYHHLSPLVSRRRSRRRGVEKGEQRGEQTAPQP